MIQPIYGIKISIGKIPWSLPGTIFHTDLLGDGTFTTLDLNEAYQARSDVAQKDFAQTHLWRPEIYTVEEKGFWTSL